MSDSESDAEINNLKIITKSDSDEFHNENVLNEFQDSDSDSDDQETKLAFIKHSNNENTEEERQKKLTAIKLERKTDAPKTIFVGNLAISVKKNQLFQFFHKHGSIKSVRLRTNDGRKITHQKQIKQLPSLNGYVVFNKENSAQNSLQENGKLFKGKHIRVNMANEKYNENSKVLFIGNLKYSATDEVLYEIFSVCGELDYVRTLRNEHGCRGIAYVGFKNNDAMHLGLELNGTMLDNRPIRVERYISNKIQKDIRLEKKINGKVKFTKDNQPIRNQKSSSIKNVRNKTLAQYENVVIRKKTKNKKSFEGKKAERGQKKHKLGQGERQKRALAKKIAPKAVSS